MDYNDARMRLMHAGFTPYEIDHMQVDEFVTLSELCDGGTTQQ